jgi:hypothetical protein
MERSTCRKCGADLPARPPGAGRPREYCGTGCRRAAEYEIRRLNSAIEVMEKALRDCRVGWNFRGDHDVPRYREELERLETRMRNLLDDPTELED